MVWNKTLNVLSDLYGGQQTLSSIYTVASVIGVVIQLVASSFIGRLKSIKKMGSIFGVLSIVALLGIMFIPGYIPGTPQMIWRVVYGLGTVLSVMYGTFGTVHSDRTVVPYKKGKRYGYCYNCIPHW